MAINIKALTKAAKETQSVDMTETSTGGEALLLPTGDYPCRLISYVELGKQRNTFDEKDTTVKEKVRLEFLAYSDLGTVRLYRTEHVSNNEKSNLKQYFDRVKEIDNTLEHVAETLGEVYAFEVVKRLNKAGKEVNDIKIVTVKKQPKFNPETGLKYEIPDFKEEDLKIFVWNCPTPETWESLYIDGQNKEGKSKNFIQETILSAVNYKGSPLELMLDGKHIPSPEELGMEEPAIPDEEDLPFDVDDDTVKGL